MNSYNIREDGAITAIHIYLRDGRERMAELLSVFGKSFTVEWSSPVKRDIFKDGITAYTVYYDDRTKTRKFEGYRNEADN